MWAGQVGKVWRVTDKADSAVIQTTSVWVLAEQRRSTGAEDKQNGVVMGGQASSRNSLSGVQGSARGEVLKMRSITKWWISKNPHRTQSWESCHGDGVLVVLAYTSISRPD